MLLKAFVVLPLAILAMAGDSHVDVRAPDTAQTHLANSALHEVLARAAPIMGTDTGCAKNSRTCNWMAKFPDDTKLVHMNLPGTHDAATGNYTQATQDSLIRYTGVIRPAEIFQCQERSLFQMLNAGIRAFDLRFAWNPGNDTVGFYHSAALLSPTTRLEDVFFGFYSWLDKHPTEAVLISLNHEGGTGTQDTVDLQQHMYDFFQTDLAKHYWVQANGTLGTLGAARGKLTFLQRYDYSLLNPASVKLFGIHLDPGHWTDNGPAIELVYNVERNQIAFIEDYYEIGLPPNSGPALNIQWKYNATTAHIENATNSNQDQLYISFASAEHTSDVPPVTPRIMALGNGTTVPGVNHKLLPFLKERKGKRFGIVMLDFYNEPEGLVEAVIGL